MDIRHGPWQFNHNSNNNREEKNLAHTCAEWSKNSWKILVQLMIMMMAMAVAAIVEYIEKFMMAWYFLNDRYKLNHIFCALNTIYDRFCLIRSWWRRRKKYTHESTHVIKHPKKTTINWLKSVWFGLQRQSNVKLQFVNDLKRLIWYPAIEW